MRPSIKDIAKKVGRSITTVSRTSHNYDDVSPETKELVRRAAEEMDYFKLHDFGRGSATAMILIAILVVFMIFYSLTVMKNTDDN